MRISLLLFSILLVSCNASKQVSNTGTGDAAYISTVTTRSEKIVKTLGIDDSVKAKHVTEIIADQYRNLNTIYNKRDEQIKQIKQKEASKQTVETEIKKANDVADKKIEKLHMSFLQKLFSQLSEEQVTKVKDGMTYNVLHVTYDAYVDMIPGLTAGQKDQIMDWLVEAREHAMDGESSEKKHWWFGKYKGRINNYLSAQGYDISKERKEWEERSQQKQGQKNTNQVQ